MKLPWHKTVTHKVVPPKPEKRVRGGYHSFLYKKFLATLDYLSTLALEGEYNE